MTIGVLVSDLHRAVADGSYAYENRPVHYEHGSIKDGVLQVKTVLDKSRELGIPIYATKFQENPLCSLVNQYTKLIIPHYYPSAFTGTNLVERLEGIDTLLVIGFNRDDSVKKTMVDALSLGYDLATSEYLLFAIKGDPERHHTLSFFSNTKGITYLKNTNKVIEYLGNSSPKK